MKTVSLSVTKDGKTHEGFAGVEFENIDEAIEFYSTNTNGKGASAVLEVLNRGAHNMQMSLVRSKLNQGLNADKINEALATHSPYLEGSRKERLTKKEMQARCLLLITQIAADGDVDTIRTVSTLGMKSGWDVAYSYLLEQGYTFGNGHTEDGTDEV
jgi:hypothetical protein